jgi:hypothetical protein
LEIEKMAKRPTIKIGTKEKKLDQFVVGAEADKPERRKTSNTTGSGLRGRPPSEEPMKRQNFYLPEAWFDFIQRLADDAFNARPGKGNKSEYVRGLIEADARKRKIEIEIT